MNITIYVEDAVAAELDTLIAQTGQSRNAIIRAAIKMWMAKHPSKVWSPLILNFQGDPQAPRFEESRAELLPPTEDPFA